jgi:hypothetical protein
MPWDASILAIANIAFVNKQPVPRNRQTLDFFHPVLRIEPDNPLEYNILRFSG